MNPNPITASRLKQLREKAGLSQEEFVKDFSTFMGRATTLSIMTVSNWETGKKLPPTDTMIWASRYYGVTTDYILGLSDAVPETPSTQAVFKTANIEIPYNEIQLHDGEAVYVTFPEGKYKNQMGLLDISKKQVVFIDFKMTLNPQCKYFIMVPPEEITLRNHMRHLINLKDMMKMDHVYIESLSPDRSIASQITGWYKNDVSGNFLINDAGRTLSYEGLGITYNAFDFKTTNKA